MIPEIQELNFPSYATLTKATVAENAMGENTISATVAIDGAIAPDFSFEWQVKYKGCKYILPTRKPQGRKQNTTITATYDLVFQHQAVYELKRYFFAEMAQVGAKYMPDKFEASLALNLKNFVVAFQKVLTYYYGNTILMDLNPDFPDTDNVFVSISNTKVWDVLVQIYELYGAAWYISTSGDVHTIKVGYAIDEMTHLFEYGFEGGFLSVERSVQSTDIVNILRGRGCDQNLPYRYFKWIDAENPTFAPDPDYIPELADIFFAEMREINFRYYIQGYKDHKYNYYTDTGEIYEGSPQSGRPTHKTTDPKRYSSNIPWAYDQGYADATAGVFDPVEWVKDDNSIAQYGEIWGALSNNNDIYPSLQGRIIDGTRIDEAVAVEQVTSDDRSSEENIYERYPIGDRSVSQTFGVNEWRRFVVMDYQQTQLRYTLDENFWFTPMEEGYNPTYALTFATEFALKVLCKDNTNNLGVWEVELGSMGLLQSLKAEIVISFWDGYNWVVQDHNFMAHGKRYKIEAVVSGYCKYTAVELGCDEVSFPYPLEVKMTKIEAGVVYPGRKGDWKSTFDIWIKNIWQSEKLISETEEEYVKRVWESILGDKEGNTAKVVFSSGNLSVSEDYEFEIYGGLENQPNLLTNGVHFDQSQKIYRCVDGWCSNTAPTPTELQIHGALVAGYPVTSEWRLTCIKCSADLETTKKYVPNTNPNQQGKAGDYFFFTGIELPHQYVLMAEEALNAWKQEQLGELADIQPTWNVKLDKIRIQTKMSGEVSTLINQITVGGGLNMRDSRMLPVAQQFFVKSKSTEYSKDAIYPSVDITLSDDITPNKGKVSSLTSEVKSLSQVVSGLANIESIVRNLTDKHYLHKDGLEDTSISPTSFLRPIKFSDQVSSDTFTKGMIGGNGWGFYLDGNKKSLLEIDRILVRESMDIAELVIHQTEYEGGSRIESAAAMVVSEVYPLNAGKRVITDGSIPTFYRCFFDQKGGSVVNMFVVNDIVRCQRYAQGWNDENKGETSVLKRYETGVVEVGVNYIDILALARLFTNGIPEVGDCIIQVGNTQDVNRQYYKIRDVVGGGYDQFFSGYNTIGATPKEYYFAGVRSGETPRFLIGYKDSQYIEWKDGVLNIFGDLNVLSKVGDTTLKAYMEDVQTQLDDKTETWYQAKNPATDWKTKEERDAHCGDFWYNSGSGTVAGVEAGKTAIYTKTGTEQSPRYVWITDSNIPQSVLDTIANKSSIYTNNAPTDYKTNDIWILPADMSLAGNEYTKGTILTATASSTYFRGDQWVKKDKYDDTQERLNLGVTTSGTVQVGNTDTEGHIYINAGITGNGAEEDALRFWAGADERHKDTAPFRVLDNGNVYANKIQTMSLEGMAFNNPVYIVDDGYTPISDDDRVYKQNSDVLDGDIEERDPETGIIITDNYGVSPLYVPLISKMGAFVVTKYDAGVTHRWFKLDFFETWQGVALYNAENPSIVVYEDGKWDYKRWQIARSLVGTTVTVYNDNKYVGTQPGEYENSIYFGGEGKILDQGSHTERLVVYDVNATYQGQTILKIGQFATFVCKHYSLPDYAQEYGTKSHDSVYWECIATGYFKDYDA